MVPENIPFVPAGGSLDTDCPVVILKARELPGCRRDKVGSEQLVNCS